MVITMIENYDTSNIIYEPLKQQIIQPKSKLININICLILPQINLSHK